MVEKALVIEDGFLGRTFDKFNLSSLVCSMLGADAFTEVYFQTESGNEYLIYCPMNEYEQRTHDWFLLNAGKLSRIPLSRKEIEKGILKIGESFSYGKGGITTPVTKITCVNTHRRYSSSCFNGAEESDIRNQFAKKVIRLYI